jgi:hypothetical protein
MSKRYESDTFRTRLYDYLTFDSTIPELLRVKKPTANPGVQPESL